MGDALLSKPPPVLSLDQIFLTKITNYYKNKKMNRQNSRSIFKDLRYLIHVVSTNHQCPKLFLYDNGIIIFSKEIIGIQKKKLSELFSYTGQGLLNCILNHQWTRITADSNEFPFDVKDIDRWKTWRFFKMPPNDIISKFLSETPDIYVRDINDIIDKRPAASSLIKLMCQCEALRRIDTNI